jgi:hypothetical protein
MTAATRCQRHRWANHAISEVIKQDGFRSSGSALELDDDMKPGNKSKFDSVEFSIHASF